jgi:hypothetical protein
MPKVKSSVRSDLKNAKNKFGKPKISSAIKEQRRMFDPPFPHGKVNLTDYSGPTSDRPLMPATAKQIAQEAKTRHQPEPYRAQFRLLPPVSTMFGTPQPIRPNTEDTPLRQRVKNQVSTHIPNLANTSMIHNIGYELATNRIKNMITGQSPRIDPTRFANAYDKSIDNFDNYRQFVKYNSRDNYELKL